MALIHPNTGIAFNHLHTLKAGIHLLPVPACAFYCLPLPYEGAQRQSRSIARVWSEEMLENDKQGIGWEVAEVGLLHMRKGSCNVRELCN
jgi:hypothetical protein